VLRRIKYGEDGPSEEGMVELGPNWNERPSQVMEFKDAKVLVTGGSRGIGKVTALAFANAGADVAVNYMRDHEAAEKTAEEIRELGRECLVLQTNVAEDAHVDRMFDEIEATWGRLDHMVSNAASGVLRPALKLKRKHWDWTMNINARSLLKLTQRAVPLMRPGSTIVGISSLGSFMAIEDYAAVGASKAALEALIRHLAVELAPDIRVNAVTAGLVDTEALNHFPQREKMLEHDLLRSPMKRHVEPQDIADAVLFLSSGMAKMVVGHSLLLDGGYHLR
jgi:enoyl-[acyl-carrier protein] reductase III